MFLLHLINPISIYYTKSTLMHFYKLYIPTDHINKYIYFN